MNNRESCAFSPCPLLLQMQGRRRCDTGEHCPPPAPNAPSGSWWWDQWPADSSLHPEPLSTQHQQSHYLIVNFLFDLEPQVKWDQQLQLTLTLTSSDQQMSEVYRFREVQWVQCSGVNNRGLTSALFKIPFFDYLNFLLPSVHQIILLVLCYALKCTGFITCIQDKPEERKLYCSLIIWKFHLSTISMQ